MEESDGDISGDADSDDDEMAEPDEEDEEDEDTIVARALGKLPPKKSDTKTKRNGASLPADGEFKRVKHNIDDEFLNLDQMNAFLDEQVAATPQCAQTCPILHHPGSCGFLIPALSCGVVR